MGEFCLRNPSYVVPYIGSGAWCTSVLCVSQKYSGIQKIILLHLIFLSSLPILIIYNNVGAMKRTDRKVSEATRKKIAEALRGKPKTAEHKQALSKSMKAYWATIPIEEK